MERFRIREITAEHRRQPVGIDVTSPRFAWILESEGYHVIQTAYRIKLSDGRKIVADTGKVHSEESIEVTVPGWEAAPMTEYTVTVTAWDNHGNQDTQISRFETGRMGVPFAAHWLEPVQMPAPCSWKNKKADLTNPDENRGSNTVQDFSGFRPAQYIRIPFETTKRIKKARVYATAHGVYHFEVNGQVPDRREFAPENTAYHKLLQYQTYDITGLLQKGRNVLGFVLGDGWWIGRVGLSGDSCQYGDRLGLLMEAVLEYEDGSRETVTGENGRSSTGPILYSDIFVGEKYDARRELNGWSLPDYMDGRWTPLLKTEAAGKHITAQNSEPVVPVKILQPKSIFTSPAGELILDAGQVLAGQLEFTVNAPEGITIKLEHTEVLNEQGNYYNNIIGTNKDQTDIYITKEGVQTYRPHFSYHGFRYVRITGWPGKIDVSQFRIYVLSSQMEDIGFFETSDERINQLQQNIWWSQVSNTLSIPTDCPQRERAGWTGDIMAYAPTMCFLRDADTFLRSWMANVRAEQLEDGAVPMVVPYLKGYELFVKGGMGFDTSCGWGDAVIAVPYAVYQAYGDKRILEENYDAMGRWMQYIRGRAENHHPSGYDSWDEEHQARSRYLWNTDFHFGDWLVPSLVLGNPDGNAMIKTAYATMEIVAPAYYAFSARSMKKIADILGKKEDAARYEKLYENIRDAFIREYVKEDGTMEADYQGIYVIALEMDLVPESLRQRMADHLCDMIKKNGGCLDTGFLSVLFLMDVLCKNGKRETARKLMFQTKCPSWLYEVEKGATTMWESWGAVGEDGSVSTYSYNHYAFGCVGDWMYREMGGLQAAEAGYKKIRIQPDTACGLQWAKAAKKTPYGVASAEWKIKKDSSVHLKVEIPVNTTAEIFLPGEESPVEVGSGKYEFFSRNPAKKREILFFAASSAAGGNTEQLSDACIQGLQEAGHKVHKVFAGTKELQDCRGCGACRKNGHQCVIQDFMQEIYPLFEKCDTIVMSSPLYFWTFSAKWKAFLDRLYAVSEEDRYPYKETMLLMTAESEEIQGFDYPVNYYKFITDALGWKNIGICCVGGCSGEPGKRKVKYKKLREAYLLGKSI